MSQWTHVSGVFRIDGLPQFGSLESDVAAALGTPSSNQFGPDWVWREGKNIPGGSEGTLQYQIVRAGQGLVWLTVVVWGDLRDFGELECPTLNEWFERVVNGQHMSTPRSREKGPLLIREAHLIVEIEGGQHYMLRAIGSGTERTICRIDLPTEDE